MSLIEASGIIDPWTTAADRAAIDPAEFRRILSHFASGVVVITGRDDHGVPVGLTCQSFTSLSLDPPLVLIAPAKSSRTWPRIAGSHRFAINILGQDHRHLSNTFARSGADKFAGIPWHPGADGMPLLADAIATIECDIDAIHHGGDHWIVTGAVRHIEAKQDAAPLVFYRSTYRALRDEQTP